MDIDLKKLLKTITKCRTNIDIEIDNDFYKSKSLTIFIAKGIEKEFCNYDVIAFLENATKEQYSQILTSLFHSCRETYHDTPLERIPEYFKQNGLFKYDLLDFDCLYIICNTINQIPPSDIKHWIKQFFYMLRAVDYIHEKMTPNIMEVVAITQYEPLKDTFRFVSGTISAQEIINKIATFTTKEHEGTPNHTMVTTDLMNNIAYPNSFQKQLSEQDLQKYFLLYTLVKMPISICDMETFAKYQTIKDVLNSLPSDFLHQNIGNGNHEQIKKHAPMQPSAASTIRLPRPYTISNMTELKFRSALTKIYYASFHDLDITLNEFLYLFGYNKGNEIHPDDSIQPTSPKIPINWLGSKSSLQARMEALYPMNMPERNQFIGKMNKIFLCKGKVCRSWANDWKSACEHNREITNTIKNIIGNIQSSSDFYKELKQEHSIPKY